MELAREIETKRLINQVNLLIDEVDYLLETATEITYLNARLEMLGPWGGEICVYIKDNNELDLLSELKPSGPLYALMLKAQMPTETRVSISHYCKMINDLREWAKSRVVVSTPQEPKVKRKPGRPRQQNRVFSDYINTKNPEKRDEITTLIATLMDSTNIILHKVWVLRAACEVGLIGKPDRDCISATFDLQLSKSTYNNGFNTNQPPAPIEYSGFINRLNAINHAID